MGLIVNCTLRDEGAGRDFRHNGLSGCGFVYDAVYNPLRTKLLRARRRGIRCSNGLDMLIFQAAQARASGEAPAFDLDAVKDKLAGQVMAQRLAEKGKSGIALCGLWAAENPITNSFSQRFGFKLLETDAIVEKRGCNTSDF